MTPPIDANAINDATELLVKITLGWFTLTALFRLSLSDWRETWRKHTNKGPYRHPHAIHHTTKGHKHDDTNVSAT